MRMGYTFSVSGDYPSTEITIILEKAGEVAEGDLAYVKHPKNGLPVVYQVTKVYSHKETRDYDEALLKEGSVIRDDERTTVRAEAYQWGWLDGEVVRPLRYPLPPHIPVFRADLGIIERFTKPSSEWKILLGTDQSSDLDVELDLYYLVRQCCLICGAVGTGKTTTAISMIARASQAEPPVKFFVIDKDGEYGSLKDIFEEKVKVVPWLSLFRSEEICLEDIISDFGWQKGWWTSKILIKAFSYLKNRGQSLTKQTLIESTEMICETKNIGFSRSEADLESYKKRVIEAIRFSRFIPNKHVEGLDPVHLLNHSRIVIVDMSHGLNGWAKKHVVLTQVLSRIFEEALENSSFGCVIVLEEAMYYAPQWTQFSIGDKDSRSRLLSIVKEIATNGGRNGVGLWVVTQRLATVDKCVSGDTPVLLSDGSLLPIKALFQSSLRENKIVLKNDVEIAVKSVDVEVVSFNPITGKIVFSKPSHFYRRKLLGKLLEINTLTGRTVKVTDEHPFYTLLEGEIVPIRAGHLKKGEFIAVPRVIKTKPLAEQETEREFLKHANQNKIPNFILNRTNRLIKEFLQAIFDREGSISKEPRIVVNSTRKDFIYKLSYLLLRFGVFSRIYRKENKNEEHYSLHIFGKENLETFQEQIGFKMRYKKERLKHQIKEISFYAGYDVIPHIQKLITEEFTDKIDCLASSIKKNVSRRKLQSVLRETENNNPKLKTLAYSDIYWDRVKSIKEVTREEFVYDLEVTNSHCFIGGCGLLVLHNTVITQCANNIISHALEDIDKKRLQEVLGDHFVELLGSLPQGEAIVKGTSLKCKFPIWVKVKPRLKPASTKAPPMLRFQTMAMKEKQLPKKF